MEASMDSSGMAPRNSAQQEEISITGTDSKGTTEWTNEKHRSFLNSMETTFVNELYKSLDLSSSWHLSRKTDPSGSKSSKRKQTSVRSFSGQFKVCRDGHWSNTNFRRDETEVDQEQKPGVLLEYPWIKHYRCFGRQVVKRSPVSCPKGVFGNTLNQNHVHKFQLSRQDSTDSNTEESGQNFNNENDLKEEEESEGITVSSADDIVSSSSSKDQVVPFGNIVQRELLLNLNEPPNDS